MPKQSAIDLLVPGLLGPMPALREIEVSPQAKFLESALSRADVGSIDAHGYAATLFHLLGITASDSRHLPTAPFCRLADGAMHDDIYWLQASPVYLRPDGDGLLLFDAEVLDITLDEARQLVDLVQEHFSDRDWKLEIYDPQRWYLGLEHQPDIKTYPLSDVIGRNIDSFLPVGSEAMFWHSLMNEMQMLLHMGGVNQKREGGGQLPINGIWLHGGGSFQSVERTVYTSIFADEPLVRGMALASGKDPVRLPRNSMEFVSKSGRSLMVYDALERSVLNADPYGWGESVELFDRWLESLLQAVRSKQLDGIDIYPCNGQVYRVDANSLRRFWRRRKPLGHYIND